MTEQDVRSEQDMRDDKDFTPDTPATDEDATDRTVMAEPDATQTAGRRPAGPKPTARTGMPTPPTGSSNKRPDMGLVATHDVQQYRDDWRSVQAGFIDDPAGAVRDADALVGRLFDTITSRISEHRSALSAHRSDDATAHTEQLRQALRDYRTMFEQLLPSP